MVTGHKTRNSLRCKALGVTGRRSYPVTKSGLWELRVDGERKTFRIFFGHTQNKIGLVHAVIKKSQRLAPKDIRLATERLKEWKEAQGE